LQTASVLRAMLEDPIDPHYGLQLSAKTGLPTGTIYPILSRLERAKWVTSAWENVSPTEEGRPRRRLYVLTGSGAHAARTALAGARQLIGEGQTASGVPQGQPEVGHA
jgi:PadR family transcriptional regulator, regulatory protein PadR